MRTVYIVLTRPSYMRTVNMPTRPCYMLTGTFSTVTLFGIDNQNLSMNCLMLGTHFYCISFLNFKFSAYRLSPPNPVRLTGCLTGCFGQ